MWTLLLELLLNVLLYKGRKTPVMFIVALAVIVIGYALLTVVSKSHISK